MTVLMVPILVILVGMTTDSSPVSSKLLLPIDQYCIIMIVITVMMVITIPIEMTLVGIVIAVSARHSLKALSPVDKNKIMLIPSNNDDDDDTDSSYTSRNINSRYVCT